MESPDCLLPRRDDLPLLACAAIRQAEQRAYQGIEPFALMARAGETAWEWARAQVSPDDPRPWLVLAGTGNNGGDAMVLASHARAAGKPVVLYASGNTSGAATDAQRARDAFLAAGGQVRSSADLLHIQTHEWACVVDGLLGIGNNEAPRGEVARLIERVNAAAHPMTLALDLPSGLDADTGHCAGVCVRARHTLSFIAAKPGLLTAQGPDHVGHLTVAPLGLCVTSEDQALADRPLLALWPNRSLNSHKGTHGDAVILGGDTGMAGAAILAGRTAVTLGAGRVFLGLLDGPHPPGYDSQQPELMMRHAESLADHGGVWCIGPGMGQSDRARTLLRQLLTHWPDVPQKAPTALVVDADALNLLAADPGMAVKFKQLSMPKVITPHPLEAARLLNSKADAVQRDRLAAARQLASLLDCITVLKGLGTVVATETRYTINLSGGPALASGGTGDVLAGALAALLAQTLTQSVGDAARASWDATRLGVFLHGATCDAMGAESVPPRLLMASELPLRMRVCLQTVTKG